MTIEWRWYRFGDFDSQTLFEYLRLRQAVFVVEQQCAYPDMDDLDVQSHHLLGWSGNQIAACLRLVPPTLKYAEPSLGRVITAKFARGTGVGHALLGQGLKGAMDLYPGLSNRIGAQAHLQGYYAQHGFVRVSEPYDEDGIAHVDMLWSPTRDV
jgi:ElaA protein